MPAELAQVKHASEGAGRPLLIAHGLFGSARNWNAIAKRLSPGRPVIAVDMRNHGQSPRADSQTYADMAGDLAALIEAEGAPMDVLGHSMGGKAAMVLALTRPDLVSRLVVADIAPVPYTHSHMGLIDAMAALDLSTVTRRGDADAALAPAIPDAATRAFLIQSLDIGPDRVAWRLNLAALKDQMPAILGFPEVDGIFEGPTLFLSGGRSDYVRSEHHARIRGLFPAAEFAALDAGHWLHAEAPGPFVEAVERFLA
ncbi:MAG: alpha/beta fold hydrolase [Rubricella sp.]